jgi:hypothetical protein
MNERTAYRIVEVKHGRPHSLFHGIHYGCEPRRTRELFMDRWIQADNRQVRDGTGPYYEGGFNVIFDLNDCFRYVDRFRAPRELRVVRIFVRGRIRPKEHSPSPVFLADEMFLSRADFEDGYRLPFDQVMVA